LGIPNGQELEGQRSARAGPTAACLAVDCAEHRRRQEGNGQGTNADRRRFFEIARGSALECASIKDCLEACEVLGAAHNAQGKAMLTWIVSMLTKRGQRNHEELENSRPYDSFDNE
jgi:hypothetical protein